LDDDEVVVAIGLREWRVESRKSTVEKDETTTKSPRLG